MRELVTFSPSEFQPDRQIGSHYSMVRGAIAVPSGWRSIRRLAEVKGPGLFPIKPILGGTVHVFPASQSFQYAVPASLSSNSGWYKQDATTTDMHSVVDELEPSDADYAFAPGAPSARELKFNLAAILDPGVDTNHYLRFRYKVVGVSGGSFAMKFRLYRGATLVKENSITGASDVGWTTVEYLVPNADIATIVSSQYAGDLDVSVEATVPGVAQTVRPDADVAVNDWTTQAGGTTNLYLTTNESSPSDADYAQSGVLFEGGQESSYEFNLASCTDPGYDPSFPIVVRMAGYNAGVKAVVKVYDGAGTFVAERSWTSLSESFTDYTITLTTAEVALISNWRLKIKVSGSYPSNVASTKFRYLRPISDEANPTGNWQDQASSTTNIYQAIDETSVNTGDYIQYLTLGSFVTGYYDCLLTDGGDPGVDREAVVNVWFLQQSGAGDDLLQLYGPSLAWQDSLDFSSTSPATYSLSVSQVAAITDWSSVVMRITAQSSGYFHRIYMLEFKVPDARRLRVSQVYASAPTLAAGYVSWYQLRTPSPASFYSGDLQTKIIGSRDKLYTIDSVSGWTDISKVGGYGATEPGAWRFSSYGPHVIGTNWLDPVQWRQNNTGLFADLITSTTKPKARYCAVIREVLMLGGINLSGHSDDEVWGSAFGNIQDFEPSPLTGARYQPIRGLPGQLTGLVGGDYGLAFKAGSIHLIRWVAGDLLWNIYTMSTGIGCAWPGSIVTADGWHYFVGGGWRIYRANDSTVEPLGGGDLWEFLRGKTGSTLAPSRVDPVSILDDDLMISGAYSRESNAIFWTFLSASDDVTYGNINKSGQLVLSLTNGRFSVCPQRRPDPDEVLDHPVTFLMGSPRTRMSNVAYVPDVDYFTFETEPDPGARQGEVTWCSPSGVEYEEMELVTQVFRVHSDSRGPARIWSILPLISSLDAPDYELKVEVALDQLMTVQYRSLTISSLDAREDGFLPVDLTGQWWRLTLTVPSSSKSVDAITAYLIEVEHRGEVSP